MAIKTLNHNKPLYREIVDQLIADIRSGTYQPGDKLPGFVELAGKFNVSRITSNRALSELAREGYVERISRRGTFVRAQPRDIRSILVPMNLRDYNECSHLTEYLYGVFSRAREKGIDVRLEPIDSDMFRGEQGLRQHGVDAVMQLGDPQYDFPYPQIRESNIPWVGVGAQQGPCPYYVCEDYRAGTMLLTNGMRNQLGERIGIIANPDYKNHQICLQGFFDAMGNTPMSQRLVCQADHTDADSMTRDFCRAEDLDGIVVCGVMCVRALEALRQDGNAIPMGILAETKATRQLEGLCFVVRLDHVETGRRAVDFICAVAAGRVSDNAVIRVPPVLASRIDT